jgi:two-component system, response regulator, stage 0 sporulation protein F
MQAQFLDKCKMILATYKSLDVVMVIDSYANPIATATSQQPSSSLRRLSVDELTKTLLRLNIARGAFEAARDSTGRISNVHIRYNAMDVILHPVGPALMVIAIGIVDSTTIPQIHNAIAKQFPLATKNALVVDDEDDIRAGIEEVLIKRGFHVQSAGSGPECLRIIDRAKSEDTEFGLIILDIRMSGMDGFEVFKKVREISKNSKVIFITAFEYTAEEIGKKVSYDRIKVLRKPFSRTDLLEAINEKEAEAGNNEVQAVTVK